MADFLRGMLCPDKCGTWNSCRLGGSDTQSLTNDIPEVAGDTSWTGVTGSRTAHWQVET